MLEGIITGWQKAGLASMSHTRMFQQLRLIMPQSESFGGSWLTGTVALRRLAGLYLIGTSVRRAEVHIRFFNACMAPENRMK